MSDSEFKECFLALRDKWLEDTMISSNTNEICNHPAYLQIITLGRRALPLIFADMMEQPRFWFKALREIVGKNPIPPEEWAKIAGKVQKMTDAWIKWAVQFGYAIDTTRDRRYS